MEDSRLGSFHGRRRRDRPFQRLTRRLAMAAKKKAKAGKKKASKKKKLVRVRFVR
jgi:hypothetical protein